MCDVWATSVPILDFLDLSVLDLDPMYATDKQTDVRRKSSLNAPYSRGGVIITLYSDSHSGRPTASAGPGAQVCCLKKISARNSRLFYNFFLLF